MGGQKDKFEIQPPLEFHPQLHSNKMRRTSERAYQQILTEGLLSTQRLEVYEYLYKHGPATGREVNQALGGPSYHKRLSELQRIGVVTEVTDVKCAVSGRIAIAWDVTDQLPSGDSKASEGNGKKTTRRPSRAQIREALLEMRELWQLQLKRGRKPGNSFARVGKWLRQIADGEDGPS